MFSLAPTTKCGVVLVLHLELLVAVPTDLLLAALRLHGDEDLDADPTELDNRLSYSRVSHAMLFHSI